MVRFLLPHLGLFFLGCPFHMSRTGLIPWSERVISVISSDCLRAVGPVVIVDRTSEEVTAALTVPGNASNPELSQLCPRAVSPRLFSSRHSRVPHCSHGP